MNDDIADRANTISQTSAGAVGTSGDTTIGFCQQCGRGLTATSQRQVGTGTFCPPCAAVRNAQSAAWQPVNAGAVPGASVPPYAGASPASQPGEPNPVLAGFLGLIPGVGAMYNGLYPKAAIHLVVFVVLVSLADNLNWVIWWFVWGWVFYQAFDAYHTAQARRDGQPLPDPFGWNELGERFSVSRGQPTPAPRTAYQEPVTSASYPYPVGTSGTPAAAPMPFNTGSSMGDKGVFSAAGFAASPQTAASSAPFQAATSASAQRPYAPAYTGVPYPAPASTGEPERISRHFPTGAAWLIGLGVLFLLANLLPAWRIDGRWFAPVLLAGIAIWIGARRIVTGREARQRGAMLASPSANVPGLLLGPSLLLSVAVLLGLQNASVLPLRHSWPAFLIVWGALLLLERSSIFRLPVSEAEAPTSVVPPAPNPPSR